MISKDSIFISYRREDSAGVTGRIYDRLVQRFDKTSIFKDVDSIPLGVNFKQHLENVVAQSRVMLVVIGGKWLSIADSKGTRRLDNPKDFVRIEIESALKRSVPIIPLLVDGAQMPAQEQLPESIQALAYYNGTSIGYDPYFHTDMNRLIRNLDILAQGAQKEEGQIVNETVVLNLVNHLKDRLENPFFGKYVYEDTFLWTDQNFFEIANALPPILQELFKVKQNENVVGMIKSLERRFTSEWSKAKHIVPSTWNGFVEISSQDSATQVFLNPIYFEYLKTRYPDAIAMVGKTYSEPVLFVHGGKLLAGIMGFRR